MSGDMRQPPVEEKPPSALHAPFFIPAEKRPDFRLWWPLWRTRWILAFLVSHRSMPAVMAWIGRHAQAGSWNDSHLTTAVFTIDRILGVPTSRIHKSCLPRSLLLYYTLTRMGVRSQMNIGLDTSSHDQGHAWVTVEGNPFMDGQNQAGLFPFLFHSSGHLTYWVNGACPPSQCT